VGDDSGAGRLSQIGRFARAHNIMVVVPAIATLALGEAFLGSRQVPLPANHETFDFRWILLIGLAALTSGSLTGPMASFEEAASRAARRLEIAYLGCVVLSVVVVVGGTEFAVTGMAEAVLAVRGLLIWSGLAMFSGRLFGWSLSCVFPFSTILPLTYWEQSATGGNRWWNWLAQPTTSGACWLLAAGSFALGVAAIAATPWRLAPLRARFHNALDRKTSALIEGTSTMSSVAPKPLLQADAEHPVADP
jgi:hypothetical protein